MPTTAVAAVRLRLPLCRCTKCLSTHTHQLSNLGTVTEPLKASVCSSVKWAEQLRPE